MERTNEEILLEYERIKFRNERNRDYYVEKIHNKIPELKEIQSEMNKIILEKMIELTKASKLEEKEKINDEFKKKIEKLEEKKENLYKIHKINKEEFEVKYDCNECKDTGFVTENYKTVKCRCYKQKQIEQKYKMSNLNDHEIKTFESFRLDYFEDLEMENGKNPKEQAEKIVDILKEYVENFETVSQKQKSGIMLIGQTGTGKTHLLEAVGNEILKKNNTVLFDTASNMFNRLLEFRFSNMVKYNEYSKQLNDVDLLIIDDLGTEALNKHKLEEIFILFNSRLSKNKPMLISTNLDLKGIGSTYGDRILSRMVERIKPIGIYGKDIRLIKARESN